MRRKRIRKTNKASQRRYREKMRECPIYQTKSIWRGIRSRCHNPNSKMFSYYGGRGILLCPEWHDFARFLADVGQRPAGMEMDRIDNDLGYEPGNVRWTTRKAQMNNRRTNFYVAPGLTLTQKAEELGMNVYTLRGRLVKGETLEQASRPPRPQRAPKRFTGEEMFAAFQMRFRGATVRAIAKALGADHGNMSRLLSGAQRAR